MGWTRSDVATLRRSRSSTTKILFLPPLYNLRFTAPEVAVWEQLKYRAINEGHSRRDKTGTSPGGGGNPLQRGRPVMRGALRRRCRVLVPRYKYRFLINT